LSPGSGDRDSLRFSDASNRFRTTRWTVVLRAQAGDSAEALESLCRNYWQPLYVYARRRGYLPHDAEDLTQAFLTRLLEKKYLRSVRREKGPFRAFLLVAFKRFMANARLSEQRLKRGGGRRILSLDSEVAERLYQSDTVLRSTDEEIYDRRWALTLLDQALARLRAEFVAAEMTAEFETLKPCLAAARGSIAYADVAARLGATEGAARVAVHRFRKRFREVFREVLAHTVATETQLDDELRHLLEVLARIG
jgi:RNA polymerase sigma-70 factor (ECF subfamily)